MTDEINSPSHYMLFPDMEAIDVIIAALTPEEFAGYCKGNALKYRLRAGAKGPAEKCIAKANWYQQKLRQQARAEFGQQNTIDCRTKEERADDIGRQLADGVRRAASGAVCNDPRTVAGVDVSFPTEKHMNFAPEVKVIGCSACHGSGHIKKQHGLALCPACSGRPYA